MPNLADVCRIGPDFEHSPTPWTTGNAYKCAKGHAIASGPIIIARVSGNGYPLGTGWAPSSQADADFIVRAVNAHDDLLAALREIESWTYAALHTKAGQPDNFGGEARKCNEIARAAIAKAEGR